MSVIDNGGEHEYSETGSARELVKGKGRYDLISPVALMRIFNYIPPERPDGVIDRHPLDNVMKHLLEYRIGDPAIDHLAAAVYYINQYIVAMCQRVVDTEPTMYFDNRLSPLVMKRLAERYELGAAKYEDRNWEKGFSSSRCLDSALRHLNKFLLSYTDEDHIIASMWNIMAIMHYESCGLVQFLDIPRYQIANKRNLTKKDLEKLEEFVTAQRAIMDNTGPEDEGW